MSTFPGKVKEIPGISIDQFTGSNLKSKVFFLSHCHADHMVGLKNAEFQNLLRSDQGIFLYCSELSKMFLSYNHLRGPSLSSKIRSLQIGQPTPVTIPGLYPGNDKHMIVTAISAGHCPGSVMFLLQYNSVNVLYTGDYRMRRKTIDSLKGLRDPSGRLHAIETLYIDTTFCHPTYSYFPSRDESIKHLLKFTRSWLDKGSNHILDVRTPATIGVEYVLIELHKEFGLSIHVRGDTYEKYRRIPELGPAVTDNPKSLIHACAFGNVNQKGFKKYHSLGGLEKDWKVRSVKLCALHARNLKSTDNIENYSEHTDLHRIVYSSHSSFSELCELVGALNPKNIEPCVVPKDSELTSEQMVNLLRTDPGSIEVEENLSSDLSPMQASTFEDFFDDDSVLEMDHSQDSNSSEKLPIHALSSSRYNVQESQEEELTLETNGSPDYDTVFSWDCGFNHKSHSATKK